MSYYYMAMRVFDLPVCPMSLWRVTSGMRQAAVRYYYMLVYRVILTYTGPMPKKRGILRI